jgi:hypothetical protein
VPNLVIAPVGANGKVDLYNRSAGTVQLVADVSGYYYLGEFVCGGAISNGVVNSCALIPAGEINARPRKTAVH